MPRYGTSEPERLLGASAETLKNKKNSEIVELLSVSSEKVDYLRCRIEELTDRLVPILSPEYPPNPIGEKPSSTCAMAEVIEQLNLRLDFLIEKVQQINDRCRL